MEQAATNGPTPPSSSDQAAKWARYGLGAGLVGILFLGIICGPAAIYFGVRSRKAAAASDSRGHARTAIVAIALGVFDIFLFLIMAVGTIRLIGTSH
jgi:hypothetical protein